MSNACPVCGNEERGQGGYLSCECPAPIDPVLAALKAAERAIDDCQSYRSHLHHKELAQVRSAIANYAAPVELDGLRKELEEAVRLLEADRVWFDGRLTGRPAGGATNERLKQIDTFLSSLKDATDGQ